MLSSLKAGFGQSLRIGIAPDALALVRTSIWPHERARLLGQVAAAGADPVSLGAALGMLLGEHEVAGLPVTVVLSDDLVRLWQVTPPQGATRLADLEAAAMMRFNALFGGGPAGWKISADWDAARGLVERAAESQVALAQGWAQTIEKLARGLERGAQRHGVAARRRDLAQQACALVRPDARAHEREGVRRDTDAQLLAEAGRERTKHAA